MSTLALWLKTYNEDAAHRDLYAGAGLDVTSSEAVQTLVLCPGDRDVRVDYQCANGCPGPWCETCEGRIS